MREGRIATENYFYLMKTSQPVFIRKSLLRKEGFREVQALNRNVRLEKTQRKVGGVELECLSAIIDAGIPYGKIIHD